MPTTKMSMRSRREYLAVKQADYLQASRRERSAMLDEMVRVTGHNRKYIIQLMRTSLERKKRRRQRGRTYGAEVEEAVLFVGKCLDFVCGTRLQPVLLSRARDLERHGEMTLSDEVAAALDRISASTIDRIYARNREKVVRRLPRKKPSRPSRASRAVPMSIIAWDEPEPGHLELDSVFHCGEDTSGDFVYTAQAVDVATGWSERYAVLGKSGMVMCDAFRIMNHRLPFPIREIHTDNGGEFLSWHMVRFWPRLVPGVRLTRNRPWRKNDSRFVEQKNFSLVRAYVGRDRYDTVAQTWAMNFLYECMGLYYNLFQPVMRVTEKILIKQEGLPTKVKRKYDKPRAPLDRLIETKVLSTEQTDSILRLRDSLNFRMLKDELEELISELKKLPGSSPHEQPNVHHTLSKHRPYIKKGEWVPR